ncbi:carbohydrate-binding module family 1 protein [Peniophora sp. CONT]|nr:carbohydrate-binding module family 1 protein [Peniophora sp. CONT]
MSKSLASFVLLAVLASPALAQTPTVSLLIDHGFPSSGTLNIKSTLADVATRKGQAFHFGSTYDTYDPDAAWTSSIFTTFFNHIVAENGCKWDATEPSRGTSSLTGCIGVQTFATSHSDTFRGHNLFWHSQTPSWLPGGISASDLVDNVIPQHVMQEVTGLGADVTSWDVVNEIVGDGVSNGMSALQCVQNKNSWPTKTSDGSSQNLVTDLSFVYAAFSNAFKYAGSSTRLAINDYNTGGNDAKTACVLAVLKDVQAETGIPWDRLAVGFQSHITAAPGQFTSKSALATTFANLATLGATAMITELDVKLSSATSANERYQAAIWGDYLDACLFASNCNEFINWDPRDDESWLGTSSAGTLFDSSGNPKPAAYEVAARLAYYAAGNPELCATAAGTGSCTINITGGSGGSGGSTTTAASVPASTPTGGSPPPAGCSTAKYGQCGGIGFSGCTTCASGSTCQVGNAYYSQCL